MGVALWAFLHLVANGDLASILFFGAFLIVALAGAPSIDAKRRRALGAARWDAFASQTSIVPFAAIARGRNRFVAGEFGLWRPLVGAARLRPVHRRPRPHHRRVAVPAVLEQSRARGGHRAGHCSFSTRPLAGQVAIEHEIAAMHRHARISCRVKAGVG